MCVAQVTIFSFTVKSSSALGSDLLLDIIYLIIYHYIGLYTFPPVHTLILHKDLKHLI